MGMLIESDIFLLSFAGCCNGFGGTLPGVLGSLAWLLHHKIPVMPFSISKVKSC